MPYPSTWDFASLPSALATEGGTYPEAPAEATAVSMAVFAKLFPILDLARDFAPFLIVY
jgi:hypothetical protein